MSSREVIIVRDFSFLEDQGISDYILFLSLVHNKKLCTRECDLDAIAYINTRTTVYANFIYSLMTKGWDKFVSYYVAENQIADLLDIDLTSSVPMYRYNFKRIIEDKELGVTIIQGDSAELCVMPAKYNYNKEVLAAIESTVIVLGVVFERFKKLSPFNEDYDDTVTVMYSLFKSCMKDLDKLVPVV